MALMQEKAWKELAGHYRRLAASLKYRATNTLQNNVTPDDFEEALKIIGEVEGATWDYNGIQSKADKNEIVLLEYLLNDNVPVK